MYSTADFLGAFFALIALALGLALIFSVFRIARDVKRMRELLECREPAPASAAFPKDDPTICPTCGISQNPDLPHRHLRPPNANG
jgi:hypothetical protein